MTTFLEDESSVEASEPREGIEIILPVATYRIATGARDVVIDGFTYTAQPGARADVGISASGDTHMLVITLPMSHPVCRRYMAGGVPPRLIIVNVWRQQTRSGLTEKMWSGAVTSLAPEGNIGKLNVSSALGEALLRRLPTISAGRACPHILYDVNCTVDRPSFAIEAIVTGINGRVITIDALGGQPDQWAEFGELEHINSGERMTIQDQTGLVITMQLPIFGIQFGDHVVVSPGCTHEIGVCSSKFANQVNYGGQPELPYRNPHMPSGYGIATS